MLVLVKTSISITIDWLYNNCYYQHQQDFDKGKYLEIQNKYISIIKMHIILKYKFIKLSIFKFVIPHILKVFKAR